MEKQSENFGLNSESSYGREVLVLLFRINPLLLKEAFEGILTELARIQYGTNPNDPKRGALFMANGFGRYDAVLILECPDYRIANRMRHIEGIKKINSHIAFLWKNVNGCNVVFTPQTLVEYPLIATTFLKIENHLILAGGREIEQEIVRLLKQQLDRMASDCGIRYDIMSTLGWQEIIVVLAANNYDTLARFPFEYANIQIDALIENIQGQNSDRDNMLHYLNQWNSYNYKSLFSRTFSINGFLTELELDYRPLYKSFDRNALELERAEYQWNEELANHIRGTMHPMLKLQYVPGMLKDSLIKQSFGEIQKRYYTFGDEDVFLDLGEQNTAEYLRNQFRFFFDSSKLNDDEKKFLNALYTFSTMTGFSPHEDFTEGFDNTRFMLKGKFQVELTDVENSPYFMLLPDSTRHILSKIFAKFNRVIENNQLYLLFLHIRPAMEYLRDLTVEVLKDDYIRNQEHVDSYCRYVVEFAELFEWSYSQLHCNSYSIFSDVDDSVPELTGGFQRIILATWGLQTYLMRLFGFDIPRSFCVVGKVNEIRTTKGMLPSALIIPMDTCYQSEWFWEIAHEVGHIIINQKHRIKSALENLTVQQALETYFLPVPGELENWEDTIRSTERSAMVEDFIYACMDAWLQEDEYQEEMGKLIKVLLGLPTGSGKESLRLPFVSRKSEPDESIITETVYDVLAGKVDIEEAFDEVRRAYRGRKWEEFIMNRGFLIRELISRLEKIRIMTNIISRLGDDELPEHELQLLEQIREEIRGKGLYSAVCREEAIDLTFDLFSDIFAYDMLFRKHLEDDSFSKYLLTFWAHYLVHHNYSYELQNRKWYICELLFRCWSVYIWDQYITDDYTLRCHPDEEWWEQEKENLFNHFKEKFEGALSQDDWFENEIYQVINEVSFEDMTSKGYMDSFRFGQIFLVAECYNPFYQNFAREDKIFPQMRDVIQQIISVWDKEWKLDFLYKRLREEERFSEAQKIEAIRATSAKVCTDDGSDVLEQLLREPSLESMRRWINHFDEEYNNIVEPLQADLHPRIKIILNLWDYSTKLLRQEY